MKKEKYKIIPVLRKTDHMFRGEIKEQDSDTETRKRFSCRSCSYKGSDIYLDLNPKAIYPRPGYGYMDRIFESGPKIRIKSWPEVPDIKKKKTNSDLNVLESDPDLNQKS